MTDATNKPLAVGMDRARLIKAMRDIHGKTDTRLRDRRFALHYLMTSPDLIDAILALAAPAEGWQGIETAPKDGTVIIAMARYTGATAGFPCFVAYMHGAWRELGRTIMEPMVCWAWRPRGILGAWPAEPAAPTEETGA